jgi:hypothetical protein
MNIKTITAIPSSEYVKKTPNLSGTKFSDVVRQALSGDIVTLESNKENGYTTYTSAGIYSDSTNNSNASASSTLTQDEKWDAITSKYRSSIMKYDDYTKMLDDLADAGLITSDEKTAAAENAWKVIEEKKQAWDIEHNRVGSSAIPSRITIIHFDELISKLSDEKNATSVNETSDRAFLKAFYTKAKSAEMTVVEKWESVVSEYKGKPMTYDNYAQMLRELARADLITFEEFSAAIFNASSMIDDKRIDYDMEDGILGNDIIPSSFYLLDFNELFTDVSNESKAYNGYDAHNDQRIFLKSFYTKMADYFPQEI